MGGDVFSVNGQNTGLEKSPPTITQLGYRES